MRVQRKDTSDDLLIVVDSDYDEHKIDTDRDLSYTYPSALE